MKPLLIMKTGQTLPALRHAGLDFEHWIIRSIGIDPAHVEVVDVFAEEVLPELESVAGVIATGSPAMVTDLAPWSEYSARYLRDAVLRELPVFGICYGHQLRAHACGGVVDYHPAGREMGTVDIELTAAARQDPLFAQLPPRFLGHTTHSQSVLKLPEKAILLASSQHDGHQSFRIGPNAWGVQFHPEFDVEIMRGYVQEREAVLLEEGFDVEILLAGIRETREATQLLRDFAHLVGLV
jgi:GMP synthase (glutamine-hydrolysing)